MRAYANALKGGLVCTAAFAFAFLSGAHAFSSASVRNSPELAAAIWPANGHALEKLAYRSFVEKVREALARPGLSVNERSSELAVNMRRNGDDVRRRAASQYATAVQALAYEPLLPKAHAILALSEADPVRQNQLIGLASQLNRRELALQGLVLQSKINSSDYPGTIEALDQILRVHPERSAEFFPSLTQAIQQPVTVVAFRDLLSRPIPWRDAFLMHAVMDPAAARNIAKIRPGLTIENQALDQALIANLVRSGDMVIAAGLYRKLARVDSQRLGVWSSDFPPFDWTFANETEMRAQPSRDGRLLEFAVDPGSGGVIASRLITRPASPFTLTVKSQVISGLSVDNLKVTLTCRGGGAPLFEAALANGKNSFEVLRVPACDYLLLDFSGRAWTGAEPLNGALSDVLITER